MDLIHCMLEAIRKENRAALVKALRGTRKDRLDYAVARATRKITMDAICYGSALYDSEQTARQAIRWFYRLERIAKGYR